MDLHKLILSINFMNVELQEIFNDCDDGVSPDTLMNRVDDLYLFGHKLEKVLREIKNNGGSLE